MRAIRQHRFGPPEVLELEEVADPAPAAGEAHITVEAAGVHMIDTVIRRAADASPSLSPSSP
ncbi:MAG TPA: hypothetical protein VHK00_02090 [Miltoncostaeaceae bacterium]|nr:hypothetical protein [Miltoncostaeaceae bacterium]